MRVATHEEFCEILETEDMTPEQCLGAWYVNMYGAMGFDEVYFLKLANETYYMVFETRSQVCITIDNMVEWIRRELIVPSMVEDSLHTTCLTIQTRIGQTDGNTAGVYFSDDKYEELMAEYILQELMDVEPIVEEFSMSYLYGQLDISFGTVETYSIDINLLANEGELVNELNDTPIHLNYYAEIKEYVSIVVNITIDENNEMTVRRGLKPLFATHTACTSWSELVELCDKYSLSDLEHKWVLKSWLGNLEVNSWLNK